MQTPFQQQTIQQIREDQNFSFFCQVQTENGLWTYDTAGTESTRKGPILVLYYTKDGVLCYKRIGQNRILASS